jgi:MFS family permease
VFALASAGADSHSNINQLIIARAGQGVGGALLVPGSLAIISASFREDERGKAIGTWSGFTAITAAIGPVLGGWLIEHVSWRAAFFINVPIALIVLLLVVSARSLRVAMKTPANSTGSAPRSRQPPSAGSCTAYSNPHGLAFQIRESCWR